MRELTSMERRFVAAYVIKPKGKWAAIQAGYSPQSASSQAYRILRRPHVKAAIEKHLTKGTGRMDVTADKTLQEYAAIAFADMGKFMRKLESGEIIIDLTGLNKGDGRLIKEITQEEFVTKVGGKAKRVRRTRLKLHDKMPALAVLARYFGLEKGFRDFGAKQPEAKSETKPLHERVQAAAENETMAANPDDTAKLN